MVMLHRRSRESTTAVAVSLWSPGGHHFEEGLWPLPHSSLTFAVGHCHLQFPEEADEYRQYVGVSGHVAVGHKVGWQNSELLDEVLQLPITAIEEFLQAFHKVKGGGICVALIIQHLHQERQVEGLTVV